MDKKRILIIEDEEDFSKGLQEILTANGFEIHTASTGKGGLTLARSIQPDLIILDIMLPEIDGYKICRLLKFDERYKKIPIILLTARTQDEDEQLGKEAGADAYLIKGQKVEALIEQIKTLLAKSHSSSSTS